MNGNGRDTLDNLRPLIAAWQAPQVGLPEVVRWAQYVADGNVRHQNTLQHSLAITILGAMVIAQIRAASAAELDGELLLTALAIHDEGEGDLGQDTLWKDKSAKGDLAEYLAFRKRYEMLGPAWRSLHAAFLLQFCLKNPECFPEDAREIMERLSATHRYEALAFEAIENWDYLLYSFEQYLERGNEKILVQVFRNQAPILNRLAAELPGFAAIWTPELSAWSKNFLARREGCWIEEKH